MGFITSKVREDRELEVLDRQLTNDDIKCKGLVLSTVVFSSSRSRIK